MEEQSTTQPEPAKKSNMMPMLAIVGLLVIAAIGFFLISGNNKSTTTSVTDTTPTTGDAGSNNPPSQAMEQSQSGYKDGTYAVTGNYTSPGGPEELGVTVTLKDGVIEDVTVEPKATRPTSKIRQADFADHYKELVVGKNIDEVVLGKVSGSSLAPKGFNDAIDKIKAEAKA